MAADFITEDQAPQIALLADPATHGLSSGAEIRHIDTHASAVFIGPERVLKLKRAVKFSFMDYSDAGRRRAACEAEVRLNRRTAPDLYLGVAPIVPGPDGVRLGDIGETPTEAVDWVTVMRPFDEATLFDRQAAEGRLGAPALIALAREIARFHGEAERVSARDWAASAAAIARGNVQDMTGDPAIDQDGLARLSAATETALDARGLDLAGRSGALRRCHGDLHLRNICLVDGRPTLFDCIEFNDDFAEIDPLYDLAFLLMDLDHHGLGPEAALVRDRYLEAVGSVAGHGLMPLYLSMRAAVRAKVGAAGAAVQEDDAEAGAMRAEAGRYLARAVAYLAPAPARLIAVGGFSGSGKSTLARLIADAVPPAPGAVVLRSDQLRKARFGAAETERLPAEAYASEVSVAVYREMESRAEALLRQGVSVIADATFTHGESRTRIEAVAARAGVPFDGLWLEAPERDLTARVTARRADASDADAAVVRRQLAAGAGALAWPRLATGAAKGDLRDAVLRMLGVEAASR